MDWIPALSSSAVLGLIGVGLGLAYKRAIEASITHAFDTKLEATKADFRREEELLRAELRARDAEFEALRSGALAGLAARHAEMGKRRIAAVEKVWANVIDAAKYKMLSKYAEVVKIDTMLEEAEKGGDAGQKVLEFAEILLKSADAVEVEPWDNAPYKERPFLPEIAWALFTAYRQLLMQPVVKLRLLVAGGNRKILADSSKMADVLKKALPGYADFIDKQGPEGHPYLIDQLEEALLSSLRQALDQKDADASAVAQAALIMSAVKELAPPPTEIAGLGA